MSKRLDQTRIDRIAAAIAEADSADYWVPEITDWETSEEWKREAYPDEYPSSAYEDRERYRKQARAALLALEPEAREEQGQVEWGVAYRQNDGKLFVDEAVEYDDAVFRVANSSVYDMVVQRRVTAYTPVGAAPAAEAREELKHGLIEDYTAVQAPDWTKVSGKLDTRDITDAEVEAAWASLSRSSHRWPDISDVRAALRAAREVE